MTRGCFGNSFTSSATIYDSPCFGALEKQPENTHVHIDRLARKTSLASDALISPNVVTSNLTNGFVAEEFLQWL